MCDLEAHLWVVPGVGQGGFVTEVFHRVSKVLGSGPERLHLHTAQTCYLENTEQNMLPDRSVIRRAAHHRDRATSL